MMMDWEWPETDALEAEERYKDVLIHMNENLKTNPDDLKGFIRLGFLCWYLQVEWGRLRDTSLTEKDYYRCERQLRELTDIGIMKYDIHPEFLWIFGYMMSLFPEVFSSRDEEKARMNGMDMLRKAQAISPEDPIIRLLILSDENEMDITKALKLQVAHLLPERFKGTGEMQQYFREVLNRTRIDIQ